MLPASAAVAIGHRRLSIVDLTTGDQPMANEDESVWVVFNGEIYNHVPLRRQLEALGHQFTTKSDTEVLAHGWEEWGEALFGRLNGIFALALVDRRSGVTVLARDPIGVKPLYLGTCEGLTWWASELGAARAAGLTTSDISLESLKLFFMFRFVPAPHGFLQRTWKIPPGHYVVLRETNAGLEPEFRRYQCEVVSSAAPQGRRQWREAVLVELEAAVTRQLMSDVPVGTLLSGGVDSSLVTQMMARHLDYRPHAFGIGFRSHGSTSETAVAQRAADVLGVPFTGTSLDDEDYLRAWPEAFGQVSEPIGNSGGLMVRLLCQTVAKTHKVVLSGQGADEPLGGYPRHVAERFRRIGRVAPAMSRWFTGMLLGQESASRLGRVLNAGDKIDRYLAIFAVLSPPTVDQIVTGGAPAIELGRDAIRPWLSPEASDDSLNDLLRVDARLSLADDLLLIADHFAMRASVELRVPFLDLQFLDLAERMPSRYKVSWFGERKWLYRQAAASYLPPALARELTGWRTRIGRKFGFTTPLDRWFGVEGGPLGSVREWLQPLYARGLVEPRAVDALAGHGNGHPMPRESLALYSLSRWLQPA
jgi:asparagine synthase (glutamine-hydrolysing)